MNKEKKKDTLPSVQILLPTGKGVQLINHFGYAKNTIIKYLSGAALTPESQARAKKVREYALNHCNGVYMPNNK